MDAIFVKVTAATPSWLDYQVMCGRKMLLSESYLAQPILWSSVTVPETEADDE